MVVVMFLVATIVFVIAHVIPGDPAAVMLGSSATAADIAALRSRLGLDASLPVQYVQFLDSVVRLRLGELIFLSRSVIQALAERAPLTLQLTVLAAGLATLIGVPIGVLSAVKRGSLVGPDADRRLHGRRQSAELLDRPDPDRIPGGAVARCCRSPATGRPTPVSGAPALPHHAGYRARHPELRR